MALLEVDVLELLLLAEEGPESGEGVFEVPDLVLVDESLVLVEELDVLRLGEAVLADVLVAEGLGGEFLDVRGLLEELVLDVDVVVGVVDELAVHEVYWSVNACLPFIMWCVVWLFRMILSLMISRFKF